MRSLTRYRSDPLTFFDDMRDTFRTIFDEFPTFSQGKPSIDVKEESEKYVIEAEVPGLKKDDIDIEMGDDLLTISSDKEEEKEEEKKGYILKERRQEAFRRSFRLPSDVDRENIKADFQNGILTIQLPRTSIAAPRRIQIENE